MIVSCADNPITHFHVLATSQSKGNQQNDPSTVVKAVGIREIKLPAYLDRPQIVTRVGENELVLSYSHQWAEPLSQSVSRVLVEALDARMPTVEVLLFPWPKAYAQDAEIRLHIHQFEIVDQQNCVLNVDWWIMSTASITVYTDQSIITVSADNKDYQAFVTAQSKALEQLSAQIANKLSTIFSRDNY